MYKQFSDKTTNLGDRVGTWALVQGKVVDEAVGTILDVAAGQKVGKVVRVVQAVLVQALFASVAEACHSHSNLWVVAWTDLEGAFQSQLLVGPFQVIRSHPEEEGEALQFEDCCRVKILFAPGRLAHSLEILWRTDQRGVPVVCTDLKRD
jgi:hypothetical protein